MLSMFYESIPLHDQITLNPIYNTIEDKPPV